MKFRSLIAIVLFAGVSCGMVRSAEPQKDAPLVEFTFKDSDSGKVPDLYNNAAFVFGKTTKLVKGPGKGMAVEFDGTQDAWAKIELGQKAQEELDGFAFTISFWARYDKPLKLGNFNWQQLGGDTGLGLKIYASGKWYFGFPVTGSVPCDASGGELGSGIWHHFQYQVDPEENYGKLLIDGVCVMHRTRGRLPLDPVIFPFNKIGNFIGAIADIRIWDHIVPLDEKVMIVPNREVFGRYLKEIEEVKGLTPGYEVTRQTMLKELRDFLAKDEVPAADNRAMDAKVVNFKRLVPFAQAAAKTSFANAPLMTIEVQPTNSFCRVPESLGPDSVVTDVMHVAAAKDEFEPCSFLLLPYQDMENVEVLQGDFKSDSGATLPASIVDRKVIKCWYQTGWDSYMGGGRMYTPDLLLNDDDLVHAKNGSNYVRVDYEDGRKYHCIEKQLKSKTKQFRWAIEPIKDADTLQPVKLEKDKAKQFWFLIHVPKDAKAGTYTAVNEVRAKGQKIGQFKIVLRVYPFALPMRCRTHYDLNQEFYFFLGGGFDLGYCLDAAQDMEKAEELLIKNLQNELDHGIFYSGAGPTGIGNSKFKEKLFRRDMEIRKKLGFPMDMLFDYGSAVDGWLWNPENKRPHTKEYIAERFELYKANWKKDMAIIKDVLGHTKVYGYGIDELDDPYTLGCQSLFVDVLQEYGGGLHSTGGNGCFLATPGEINIHAVPTTIPKWQANNFHLVHAKLMCYAGPFAGPDDPYYTRYRHGLRNYFNNGDGTQFLWYARAKNPWNEFNGGPYRNFQLVISTTNGPLNTLGFEGCREGIDDVKYATLFRLLADECMKSANPKAKELARTYLTWYAKTTPLPYGINMDKFRQALAELIISMMKVLGKETM